MKFLLPVCLLSVAVSAMPGRRLVRQAFQLHTLTSGTARGTPSVSTGPGDPRDCYDFNVGSTRKHTESWIIANAWKFHCLNTKIIPVGCVASSGFEVPINQTINKDGIDHKCWQENGRLRYQERGPGQVAGCTVNGVNYKINDTFRIRNFQARCLPNKLEIIGCYYKDAAGNYVKLPVGSEAKVGTKIHVCKPSEQGIPQYGTKNTECTKNGKTHQRGEVWVQDNFKVTCTEHGTIKTLACVSSDGKEIPVGEKKEVSPGRVGHCRRVGRLVFYDESFSSTNRSSHPGAGPLAEVVSENSVTVVPDTKGTSNDGCKDDTGATQAVGTAWTGGNFMYQCEGAGRKRVVGCVTDGGVKIPINQGVMFNGRDHSCILRNNVVRYAQKNAEHIMPRRTECNRNGKKYKVGVIWTEPLSPFKYTCNDNVVVDIIACILPGTKQEVIVGESLQSGGLIHKCIRSGNRVTYRSDVIPKKL